jgi:hypothetical protein
MTVRDWSAAVADPRALLDVVGTPPPPLTDFKLSALTIDEREASVTLWFYSFAAPAGAAELWHARGHNAFEFFLLCVGVRNLAVDGWSGGPLTAITLDGASVALTGPRTRVTFDVDEILADAPVGRRAGTSP